MVSLVVGFIAAFLLAVLPGRALITRLRRIGVGQNISADAPQTHGKKQGTPTMGGLLILFALTITTLAYVGSTQMGTHRLQSDDFGLLPLLLLTLSYGAIGFADDSLSLARGRNMGLRAREKFLAQCIVGVGFLLWLAHKAQPGVTTHVALMPSQFLNVVTGTSWDTIDLGLWYYPVALFLIVGLSNAANFTDGLDGLLSGVAILICLVLSALVAVMQPDLAFYAVTMAGGVAGFLWWNAHPARVFMGDTASLALGAGLAGIAIIGKQEIALIVASLVCWAELISVMIQVSVFKWRRRRHGVEYARAHRVFRRTPLHHHFEEAGLPETQVVLRFWLASALCCAFALLWGRGNG